MVVLYVKQSENQQFLYRCQVSDLVDHVLRDIVGIHNLQLKIAHLKEEGDRLAVHGPYKDPSFVDDDDSDEDAGGPECSYSRKPRGPFYNRDPANRRTGEACDPEVSKVLRKALAEAETCASKEQALNNIGLTESMLKEAIQSVRGAVMICYPMGLPLFDPVQQELAGTYRNRFPSWQPAPFGLIDLDLQNAVHSIKRSSLISLSSHSELSFSGKPDKDALDPDTATMWWAGKELMRMNKLLDHVGRNEKTKVIVKLQTQGHGAPPREPPVDGETQKAMMAWYYKKQEEEKALKANEDDTYTNSPWANPKALKSHLNSLTNIHMR